MPSVCGMTYSLELGEHKEKMSLLFVLRLNFPVERDLGYLSILLMADVGETEFSSPVRSFKARVLLSLSQLLKQITHPAAVHTFPCSHPREGLSWSRCNVQLFPLNFQGHNHSA